MKKTVGIFTTFHNWSDQYSLTSVVRDQLEMHLIHSDNYKVVLFVLPSFKDDARVPEGVEIRKVIPQIILEPYKGQSFPETWKEDAEKVRVAIEERAQDIDFAIAHDWIFIDCYLPYNIGAREAKIKAKWFHWIHSAPSPRPVLDDNPHSNRYVLPPHSKLVYLNNDKPLALAEMYGAWLSDVRVVPNSIDPRTFWDITPFTYNIIGMLNLMHADIITVYPVSTPRMEDGKQISVVIRIHGALKKLGLSTRLIVPNAHANQKEEKAMVERMNLLAQSVGLTGSEVVFTSVFGAEYEHGIPRSVVSELFKLSNVFIFPSISENCSLILLEAMLAGNLLVLNKDCTSLREFGGEAALYFKMGNLDMGTRNTEHALENQNYITDIAKIIKAEWANSRTIQAKLRVMKRHNLEATWKKIEDLYYEYDNMPMV